MEQKHRDIIRRHYQTLVKEMNTESVIRKLHDMKVLTEEMKLNIEAEQTKYSKNRKLLEIIHRRGPHAFTALRKALLRSGNWSWRGS